MLAIFAKILALFAASIICWFAFAFLVLVPGYLGRIADAMEQLAGITDEARKGDE